MIVTSAAASDDHFKNSLAVSAGLHIALLLFLYFGLPHLLQPLPAHHDPVPFEIVELADMTNTRIKDEVKPQPPAPPPVPTPPQQQASPTPPAPPPPQPQAKPTPPSVPVPPQPEAESLKPKPVERVKVEQPKPKPAPDFMASVLKNVAKLKPAEVQKPVEAKPDAKAQPQQPAKSAAPTLSDRLTISDEDALRRQIGLCWNPPMGARDAQNLVVEITIDVNPDKTVANAAIVDLGRYNSDSFFRAAADAAIRAVRNPQCSPLILPDGKYDQWKRIDFTFDPRDM